VDALYNDIPLSSRLIGGPARAGLSLPLRANEDDNAVVNCVIRRLREQLTVGAAKKGPGRKPKPATPKQLDALTRWEAKLASDVGCTFEDLGKLENALEVRIMVYNFAGDVVWSSGKWLQAKECSFTAHNGHAYPRDPKRPAKYDRFEFYDEELVERTINRKEGSTKPSVVCDALPEAGDLVTAQVLRLAMAKMASSAGAVWLMGRCFVYVNAKSEAVLVKPYSLQRQIDTVIGEENNVDPQDLSPELQLLANSSMSTTTLSFKRFKAENNIEPT
jgi:hypothetical protein